VTLLVDGKPAGDPVAFDETTEGAIVFPDASALLPPGKHRIELAMTDGSEMPYAVEVTIHRRTPESSPDCPLKLSVTLSDADVAEGEIAVADVLLTSRSAEPLPMAVVIVGIPGGLEVRHEQLKELVQGKRIAAYEVVGREVVLYFRTLRANAEERIPLSLVASVPGTYTGPASRAYLYYGDEDKVWTPGLKASVSPR
jgi:alpha-2-macroglobulin-like protein